jgi:hypothetical protein
MGRIYFIDSLYQITFNYFISYTFLFFSIKIYFWRRTSSGSFFFFQKKNKYIKISKSGHDRPTFFARKINYFISYTFLFFSIKIYFWRRPSSGSFFFFFKKKINIMISKNTADVFPTTHQKIKPNHKTVKFIILKENHLKR